MKRWAAAFAFVLAVPFTALVWFMHYNAGRAEERMPLVTALLVCGWLMLAGAAGLAGLALFNAVPGARWFGLMGRGPAALFPLACLLLGLASAGAD